MSKLDKNDPKSTGASVNGGTSGDKKSVPRDIKVSLLMSVVSATLRLVVPVMGLFLIGLMIDASMDDSITWAVVGVVVGFVIAAWLIYLQIKGIRATEAKRSK